MDLPKIHLIFTYSTLDLPIFTTSELLPIAAPMRLDGAVKSTVRTDSISVL